MTYVPPVPDSSIPVLQQSAANIDEFATGVNDTYTDRGGVSHKTVEGVIKGAEQDIATAVAGVISDANAKIEAAIINAGYVVKGTFTSGASLLNANDVIQWTTGGGGSGEYYRWGGSLPKNVPASSTPGGTGGFGPEAWVLVASAEGIANNTKNFNTIAEAKVASYLDLGDIVETNEYATGWGFESGAKYIVVNSGPDDGAFFHELDNGLFLQWLYSAMPSVTQAGINPISPVDDEAQWNDVVANNSSPIKIWMVPDGTYMMSIFRIREQKLICSKDAVFNLFYGGITPVMGQINSGAHIIGLNLQCTEADLDLSRCSFENAQGVIWEDGSIKGFRDVSGSVDAWGAYLKSSKNITLRNIEFDDNSQSDIAIVDNNENITIDNCWSTSDTLHINVEPNTSTDVNKNINLNSMDIRNLDILENGSGGTATKNIQVNSCDIDFLKYDGGTAQFNSCIIEGVLQETDGFMGQARFVNSIGIGQNLIEDPNLINIGNSSGETTTNFNSWYVRSRTGDFAGSSDRIVVGETDGGSRFTKINPNNLTGTLVFSPHQNISTVAGETYLVAVTGRVINGTSGRYLDIFETSFGSDKEYVLLRQSNDGSTEFQTDIALIPITSSGVLDIKFGILENTTTQLDIAAISVHKVDFTVRKDNGQFLEIHSLKERRSVVTRGKPVMANINLTGWQYGDRAHFEVNDYVWDESVPEFKTVTIS